MLPLRRLQHNRLLFVWMATSLAVLAVGCGGQEMPESTTIDETFSNGNNTDATTKNTNSMRIEDIFLWRKLGGERLGLDLLPDGLHQELLKLFMFPTGVTSSPNVSRQCVEDTVFYYNNLLTEGSDWATKSKSTINQRCTIQYSFSSRLVLYCTVPYSMIIAITLLIIASVGNVRSTTDWSADDGKLSRRRIVRRMSNDPHGTQSIQRPILQCLFQTGSTGQHWPVCQTRNHIDQHLSTRGWEFKHRNGFEKNVRLVFESDAESRSETRQTRWLDVLDQQSDFQFVFAVVVHGLWLGQRRFANGRSLRHC